MWPVALPTGIPFVYMKHSLLVQILLNHLLVMWVFQLKWANTPSNCLIPWYKFSLQNYSSVKTFACNGMWRYGIQVGTWHFVIAWWFPVFHRTIATSFSRSSSPRPTEDEGDILVILQNGWNCSSNITVWEPQVSQHGGSPLSAQVINFVSFWS
jgi:hypothetical protein